MQTRKIKKDEYFSSSGYDVAQRTYPCIVTVEFPGEEPKKFELMTRGPLTKDSLHKFSKDHNFTSLRHPLVSVKTMSVFDEDGDFLGYEYILRPKK